MLTMNAPLLLSYEVYAAPCITMGLSEDMIGYRFGFQFYERMFLWLRSD